MKKKIITIVGARPQIIKSSAINRAIKEHFNTQLEEIIVHTGQHYDENMSEVFFEEMTISKANYNLHVGSGSHGSQTAKMLEGLEAIFQSESPHAVLVYGDTNSTLAGALAAVKLHIPVIHIEAGLRSFNKTMPEEVNRIACDHVSTLLFTPTKTGLDNLSREGFDISSTQKASINSPKVYHSGDIMFDNSRYFSQKSHQQSTILKVHGLEDNHYILVTIHRDSNTDVAENMEQIFSALLEIQQTEQLTIVLPIHPRTKNKLKEQLSEQLFHEIINNEQFKIIPPVGFLDVIALEKHAKLVITDSGGLQKEAFFFEKPCVILRPQTEWVEIVENGNAQLADASRERIIAGVRHFIVEKALNYPPLYGDGNAAIFICQKIIEELEV